MITVEFIGYASRAAASNNTGKLMPYIIQSVFVLLAPTLFAAAVYIVLAHIIRAVNGERYSPIPMNLITKIFISCDIVTFFVQGGGAGMTVENSLANIGEYIVIAGLVLQIATFILFVITAVIFSRRMRKNPTPAAVQCDIPWTKHLRSLYTVSAMILIRSIFRLIEYGLGNNGYLLGHEWPTYVFDSVPMFLGMICFGIWYPSALQPFLMKTPSSA